MATARIDAHALQQFLREHPQWTADKEVLSRTFELPSFLDGIRFVDRLAAAAERANHHPDIDIRYTKIRIALTTHDAGGLTAKDTALAAEADTLARA